MNNIPPLNYSTLSSQYVQTPKYEKFYGVRISFDKEYYDYQATHQVLSDWFGDHKRCFNWIWLQPEYYPTKTKRKYSQIHYHGVLNIKDLRAFTRGFLSKIKCHFQCHYFNIDDFKRYMAYCNKEVGITEAMTSILINARALVRERSLARH